MFAPRSWLSDFVSLSGISDAQFAREMTFAGNKVESIQKVNSETVFEFEITSNRPDTLSIIGLAREAAAVFDRQLTLPKTPYKKNLKRNPISLTVADKKICPVFSVVELDQMTVKPSSALVRKRLELSGIRPVNNVVDVTNYVMLETGQPMHAFDADKIRGPLTVRCAKPKERLVPLDHKQRILHGGEIIIEDKEKLIDLAGLMGGLNSEISEKTTHVYLLIPIYDPVAIRRASKYLRLRTEASNRFEKKLDLTQAESTALRAIELLETETGGEQRTTIMTRINDVVSVPTIALSPEDVSSLVGRPFTPEEIEKYLKKVGVEKTATGFQPPPWRRDLILPVDLLEEVTRLYGYNKLSRTLPTGEIPIYPDALISNWKRIVADQCVGLGYTETYASTLIGESFIEESKFYSTDQHLKVLHSMSRDYEYMRRTVLQTLIPFLKQNLIHTDNIRLFELGTVFIPAQKSSDLPEQPLELGLISTTHSYREFRGQIEEIGKTLGISVGFSPADDDLGAMTNVVDVFLFSKRVGQIGLLSPQVTGKTDVTAYAGYFDMTEIFKSATHSFRYPRLSGYPPIIEDFTLQRPKDKFIGDAIRIIQKTSPLVSCVEYIGEYQGFVTIRLNFQSLTRSLTQGEVNDIKEKMLKKLKSENWTLKPVTESASARG